ncbi:unnamed protein product [Brassica napus]|uniref:(rape) hypothetical protein n=1 Tax=Brassica napus TaxID=3708 RepID=A0A816NCV9_BRANA|nr:unnamed protein product [Brassica napus]
MLINTQYIIKVLNFQEKMQFRELFPVVICDSSALVNLAFWMTSVGFQELQDEASSTLKCMKLRDGGFEEVFMTKVDFPVKYDHCIRLHLKVKTEVSTSGFCLDKESKSIRVVWRNTNQDWHVESSGLSVLDREALFIGISIENAFRTVDIGPDAESKIEALRFRNFWGDKSELKNERIAESTAYEDLSKCLRQIKGIPTMKVMIQLEGSGNWPMDDLAIEKTKTAFLLQIAENLQNVKGVPCTATEDNVDVFMGSYAFRLRISHERGLSLVKREGKNFFSWSHHISVILSS